MADAKENQLFDFYYNKIAKKVFDEKDVYAFLILIRSYAQKNSPVYEFSNFVAHREKDRGYIQEYVWDKKKILDKLGKINATLKIQEIFTFQQIEKSFNSILESKGKQKLSSEIIQDIILCIIVLLQDVRLFDKKNRPIGNLAIGINKNEISLLGQIAVKNNKGNTVHVVFPALIVPNNYTKMFNDDEEHVLKVVVEVIRVINKLELRYLSNEKISEDWDK